MPVLGASMVDDMKRARVLRMEQASARKEGGSATTARESASAGRLTSWGVVGGRRGVTKTFRLLSGQDCEEEEDAWRQRRIGEVGRSIWTSRLNLIAGGALSSGDLCGDCGCLVLSEGA